MSVLATPEGMAFPPSSQPVWGEWRAIYLEPMVGSGERLCVAIALATADGFEVVQVPALPRLQCIYGDAVQTLISTTELVVSSMKQHLARHGAQGLRTWETPLDGFHLGAITAGAGSSLQQIVRGALTMSASLVEQLSEGTTEEDAAHGVTTPRLERMVRDRVILVRPNLDRYFSVKRQRRADQRSVTIGFLGSAIAANFGVILPSNLGGNVRDIKSKLWDLANVREEISARSLFPTTIHKFEMLVYRPHPDEPMFSDRQMKSIDEAANELEAEADSMKVRCKTMTSFEPMSEIILQAEAA